MGQSLLLCVPDMASPWFQVTLLLFMSFRKLSCTSPIQLPEEIPEGATYCTNVCDDYDCRLECEYDELDYGGDVCDYQCFEEGGCSVTYNGPPRDGPVFGSCSPAAYRGGSCTSTPPECVECKEVKSCNIGVDPVPTTRPRVVVDPVPGDLCSYECNANGGCTVRYTGPFRNGRVAGSCFPESFGGRCSGTPPECEDCNRVKYCVEN